MRTMPTQTFQTTQLTPKPLSPLKYQRLLRSWSQTELAKHIYNLCLRDGHKHVGVNEDLISRWEHGKHRPSLLYRKQLCEIFGMTALQLGFLSEQDQNHHLDDTSETQPLITTFQRSDNPPPSQDAAQ
jgi:transcriptional regulator with XRE-family HTH domain